MHRVFLALSFGLLTAAPLAFAALTLFHPFVHPADLDGTGRWLTVHVLQLVGEANPRCHAGCASKLPAHSATTQRKS